jgi:hypothetical protein
MSIVSFIKKIAVQSAIYWSNPVNDGFGGYTFDEPVVIKCRWDDMQRIYTGQDGQQVQQKAKLLIPTDENMMIKGWLMLGTLDDLQVSDTGVYQQPSNEIGAYQIIGVDRTPLIKSRTVFVTTVYLGFGNMY